MFKRSVDKDKKLKKEAPKDDDATPIVAPPETWTVPDAPDMRIGSTNVGALACPVCGTVVKGLTCEVDGWRKE